MASIASSNTTTTNSGVECKEFKDLCLSVTEAKDEKQLSASMEKIPPGMFSKLSDKNKITLVETGLIPHIIRLIQNFAHPSSIIRKVTNLARLITILTSAASNQGIDEVVHAAGGLHMAATMIKFDFQTPTCLILIANIIGETSLEYDEDVIQTIDEGCATVIEHHERHLDSAAYVIDALLTTIDSSQCLLGALDKFITHLFKIMDHKCAEPICRYAVRTLARIMKHKKAKTILLARSELVDKITSLFYPEPGQEGDRLFQEAFAVLASVSMSSDSKHIAMLLENKNVAPMIKRMMNDHPESVMPHSFITNLAMEDTVAKCWIIDSGLFPHHVHPERAVMRIQLKTLCSFYGKDPIHHSLFMANGGLKLMADLIALNERDGQYRNFAPSELISKAKRIVERGA